MIEVRELRKEFRIYRHHRGGLGALRNLVTREYRSVLAVDGITFDIKAGELVGYLGPNGAGKSTTLKMLTGILVPTSGHLVVNGRVPHEQRKQHAREIGAVFGQRTTLWWDLPVVESLDLLRAIYRVPADRYRANLALFGDLLGLGEFLDTPVRSLSLGQRMRADLAAALLHDPALLFLDEPTIGLDVVAKERIRGFIKTVNRERGTTVILTTHDLGDVEKLCERVIMIDRGKIMFDGALETLRRRFGQGRVLVVDFEQLPDGFDFPGAELMRAEGNRAWLRVAGEGTALAPLVADLFRQHRVLDLSVQEPEIEAVVRRIYEGHLLEA
ncbi:MAG: ATP-binding cassette domain-containing protein [Anaerolineae bacterium]|jgi:ABC-2 type transport system ATP-binding protein|nr:ATP-binding cassette domain-containing protein [Anaerolineae bacterium]